MQPNGWDAYWFASWRHRILKNKGISQIIFIHKCILQTGKLSNWGNTHSNLTRLWRRPDQNQSGLSVFSVSIFPHVLNSWCAFLCWGLLSQPHPSLLYSHSQGIVLIVPLFLNIITAVSDARQVLWTQLTNSLSSTLPFI